MKLPALKEIIEERKGKAIESLSDSFARNKLPLEEYERLVEYITKIESERELVVVEKIVSEYGAEYGAGNDAAHDDEDEPDFRPSQSGNLTILSSRTFSGPLISGSQFVNILGSEHIKVRKSDLQKRQTFLDVVSILGDCVIHVESGIRVTNKAIPILGSARVNNKVSSQVRQGDPELVISGVALLADISVKLLKE
ncbi:MAG: hypothetical protein LBH42_00855 [Treponema sp.]|jgi:hypothetical protein|nr:hypothetical protein [Treponema sp.]